MKPYSFEWWLALYDCALNRRADILLSKGDLNIDSFTLYEELRKWIRQRVVESHYNEISNAVWEYH